MLAGVIEDAGAVDKLDRAAAGAAAHAADSATPFLQVPSHWPIQADLLTWCHSMSPGVAVLLIMGGVVYLLFGLYIFRALVTVNAAIVGAYVGALLGQAGGTEVPAAVVGALLAAAATWPIIKHAVGIMGGIFGALLGATIWRLCSLDPAFTWSGALTGMVFFGLLSFLLFRQCIMTYTSLQGAVMLVFGALGLIFKYDQVSDAMIHSFQIKPFLLPMAIFIPTLVGLIYQQAMFPASVAAHPPAAAPAKK